MTTANHTAGKRSKLSPTQREVLLRAAKRPRGLAVGPRGTLRALLDRGLLHHPLWGNTHYITDAGRAAIEEAAHARG